MDDVKKLDDPMTVVEAIDLIEEFKQKIVDDSYDQLLEEGETQASVNMELVDAIESLLYYVKTLDQVETEEP